MNRRHPRRAFTFVELMLGLVILSMIGGAVSAVALAVSAGWRQGESSRMLSMSATVPVQAMATALRQARYLGYVQPGGVGGPNSLPAGAMFWRYDGFGPTGTPDGKIQLGELALLEYDVGLQAIHLYEPIAYADMTPSQQLAAGDDPLAVTSYAGLVTNPNAASEFKAFLSTNGIRVRRTLARYVTAAEFRPVTADSTTSPVRPGLEILYRVERGAAQDATAASGSSRSHLEYQFVALRSATRRPG